MFVVQVKRIHEYKRQLLAILQVVALYLKIKREPNLEVTPRSYIFAGKAAAGYQTAKLHIRLINDVGAMINEDRSIGGRIKVAFIPNYGVSIAEVIFPGSDLSVQISLAGKEASGTGNMKFAMNGALTIGTLDGANIELRQAVGEENFFLFGLTAPEVKKLRQEGYDPNLFIARSPELREVVELLDSGFLSPEDRGRFLPVVRSLRGDDPFMVCADFDEYLRTEALAAETFRERRTWSRRALLNIAGSARFSSDETVRAYARDIWGVHPVPVEPNRIGEH
jgi:starch phosphorylase